MVVDKSELTSSRIEELRKIVGDRNVLTYAHDRAARSATIFPFPVYDWKSFLADAVLLPGSTDEVSEILRIANKYRIPVVPRAAGSGFTFGAVPVKKGIAIDIKRMNQILEVDEENMCVTTQTGINNQELARTIKKYDLWWPFNPASFPVSIIGGNIGTGAWSLIGGVSGHIPDLVLSMVVVLPTGKVVEIGEGGGRKIRKSSTGYRLKDLFIGHQGTLGIATEATLDVFPRPEAEFAAFFGYRNFEEAYSNLRKLSHSFLRTMAGLFILDEEKIDFYRRDDEAYLQVPDSVKAVVGAIFYGTEGEVEAASKKSFQLARDGGGSYLGEQISEEDWGSRHDRYHLSLHGRTPTGDVMPSHWYCEDAAVLYSELPEVRKEWHAVMRKFKEKYGIFDDGGSFFYNNSPFRSWGDYLGELDIFMPEKDFTSEMYGWFVALKGEISRVTLAHQGSISAAHGATRPGDDEMLQYELRNGMYDIMKTIKRIFDPINILNPGKFGFDSANQIEREEDESNLFRKQKDTIAS